MLFDVLSRIFFPVVATLITDPVKDYVVKPVKRHISYVFKCDSKVEKLQDAVLHLKNKKLRLQQSIVEAIRNAEQIHENVNKWLGTARIEIEEAETLIQGKEEATKKCFAGLCPSVKTRYQLSKRADKKVLAIDKQLQNAEGLTPLSFRPPPQQIVEPSSYSREGLPSRVLMLNKIMEALKDPNLNIIGVYGMGGVGKTTLAKEVQAKAIQEKLFETVIMVAVSQTPELRRIQSEIADFLGLKFDVEEVPGRASRLYDRLKNSKVLIILDDIWQKLELKSVGIPFGVECKSCKILLTSRRRDVLSCEMEAQKEFSLDVLGEEEAWSLFQVIVAKTRDPKFHSIAIEIAKKCSGLPLLILIVAKELQTKESYAWIDMLKQLSVHGNEDIHSRVHKVPESSFENLPGEEIKSLFLLCALFPQSNIRIQNLLIYSMGLSLFKHRITIEEARNRLLTLINKLKAECLLLDGDMKGFVKMHDVVRDAAISIASMSQHAFVGASQVRSTDWPKHDRRRISLPYCDVHVLPKILECPKADLLLLFTEDLCLEIPDLFFEEVRQLKVLDFTGMRLVSLPSSFKLLINLHSLCLHKCRLDDVAIIGELKQLELLSFADSEIVELPRQIEALTKLRLLDVRNCSNLQVIPANAISKLCSLEEIYMLNSFVRWDVKDNASLVELENLSHLSTLEIQILNPQLIPKSRMLFDRLRSHKISIGNKWNWNGKYETSRTLKLQLRANGVGGVIHLEDGVEVLLSRTEDLYLEVGGIESVLYDLQREGFPQLKHLHIQNDFGIQHLIKSTTRASCHAFEILESLFLNNLNSLEKICDGQLAIGSFGKLQTINIRSCKQLKNLFSSSFVKCLWQLQEMYLGYCNNMETIVGQASEDYNSSNEVIELTQLSSLKLSTLPHLTGFCKRLERHGQMELLLNEMIVFPNLTSLDLYSCESLKYVFTTSMVKYLMQLKTLQIGFCEQVEEIIESKRCGEIEEPVDKIVFPKLDYVRLYSLPNMKSFCRYPIEFQTLRELKIDRCYALKNFVSEIPGRSNSSANDEYLFTEMVAFSNLEILHITDIIKFRYLWHEQFAADDSFSKLKTLNIDSCSKLLIVFTSKLLIRFRRLETLQVSSCESVEEVYQYQGTHFAEINNVEAFSLEKLELFCLPSLKHIWSKDACEAFTFENLRIVYVLYCKDLKYVFSESITCRLFHLEDLKIEYCDVEVIIRKAEDNELESEPSFFMFPQLTSLQLVHLKEMRSLSDGSYTFEWPNLKVFEVTGCSKLMEIGSKTHGSGRQDKEIEQSRHFVEKLIPEMEAMILDNQGLKAILSSELLVDFTSKLKKLTICSSEEESVSSVFGFLGQFYSLEILSLEDIFLLDDERAVGEAQHHPRLKHLKLSSVTNLNRILKKDSLLSPILQYLRTLEVQNCNDLMNITPFSGSFRNLTILNVEGCKEMTSLVMVSTAKNMVQLVELRVSDCPIMEDVIKNDGDFTKHDEIFFNKLRKLKLSYLNLLNSFSPDNCTFNFPLLEEVVVYGCSNMKIFSGGILSTPKLRGILFEYEQQWEGNLNATIARQSRKWDVESLEVAKDAFSSKAILANQMQWLNKLRKITVRDCDLVQVVFDLEGLFSEEGHVWLLPQLNELHLANLPILSQLCNTAPRGILDFNKLEVLKIDNCSRLEYAFTWSMASCLIHLQRVELKNCEKMEKFIKEEEADRDDTAQVIFGSLESIVLECLPKFSSFYSGSGDLECPSLKMICIIECPRIKAFISRLTREDKGGNLDIEDCDIHFGHKGLPDLEKLSVDVKSMSAILQFEELPTNFFSKVKDLDLRYFSAKTKSDLPLLHFLSILPSLQEFEVCHSSLKDLFKFEGFNTNLEEAMTLLQIRSLKLQDLDELKHVWWQNSQFHASLFQTLKTLSVRSCGNLICLASAPASFENLTSLEVDGCNQLTILISLSVAKTMVQLETLSVTSCNMLTEVVGDGNDDGTTDEVVFTKMKSIYFSGLPRLKSFSFGCSSFKFPCLERLILIRCPNLGIFCPGTIITPMLDSIVYHFDRKLYSKGDVNTIVENMYEKMVGFEDHKDIKLSIFPVLKEKWDGRFPFGYFDSVEWLVVDDCALCSNAISSDLIQYLRRLEVLIVEKCDSMEQVFGLEGLNADEYGNKQMKNLNQLQLIDLPSLRHVWSKDLQQILSFENLQQLKVHNCASLTYIFNLSMASNLRNLQHVEVKNCSSVEHIISKLEAETMQEPQTILPSLQSMILQDLTNLSSFYSENGFLECMALTIIEVVECPNIEIFSAMLSKKPDSCVVLEENEERVMSAFLGNQIAIPGLEELKVGWNTLKDKLNGGNQPEVLCRLKTIELTGFHGVENAIWPSNFVQHFPNLEKLALSDSLVEEINLQELSILEGHGAESLVLLTKLKLSNLPMLKHLVHDDSELVPLFQILEDLEVVECSRLKILVPSTVLFQNLTNLEVSKCDGLTNLMTVSTARSLMQLKRMNVKDCKMMHEIVAIASDEVEHEIRFSELEYLGLNDLPCLTSFCSENYAFHCPSLKEVIVAGCPDMKMFSEQVPTAPKLWRVKTGIHDYEWEWEGSLNNTMQALFLEKDVEEMNT